MFTDSALTIWDGAFSLSVGGSDSSCSDTLLYGSGISSFIASITIPWYLHTSHLQARPQPQRSRQRRQLRQWNRQRSTCARPRRTTATTSASRGATTPASTTERSKATISESMATHSGPPPSSPVLKSDAYLLVIQSSLPPQSLTVCCCCHLLTEYTCTSGV